jgi:hypothetical protein
MQTPPGQTTGMADAAVEPSTVATAAKRVDFTMDGIRMSVLQFDVAQRYADAMPTSKTHIFQWDEF